MGKPHTGRVTLADRGSVRRLALLIGLMAVAAGWAYFTLIRMHSPFPSEGAALPAGIPGVGNSDHWAFWQHGYPAAMVTDTAPFRYPHYHDPTDTPGKLHYSDLARVTDGLIMVVADLAGVPR